MNKEACFTRALLQDTCCAQTSNKDNKNINFTRTCLGVYTRTYMCYIFVVKHTNVSYINLSQFSFVTKFGLLKLKLGNILIIYITFMLAK